jgi:hypothetical protein
MLLLAAGSVVGWGDAGKGRVGSAGAAVRRVGSGPYDGRSEPWNREDPCRGLVPCKGATSATKSA